MEENVYSGRTTINQIQRGRNRSWKEDVQITHCRVWNETVKNKERLCKEESASELRV